MGARKRTFEVSLSARHGQGRLPGRHDGLSQFGLRHGRQGERPDDLHRYCLPHRESRGWKELYNKRTSVECCNSRLKDDLTANRLQVWGIQKVTTHLYLIAIVLLVSALAVTKQPKITTA
uniref:transposase n=1 Tax=Paenibacillus zanthoxyli TaxID=369399 RepID=UPI0038CD7B6F